VVKDGRWEDWKMEGESLREMNRYEWAESKPSRCYCE
jgi:hypothetical protein